MTPEIQFLLDRALADVNTLPPEKRAKLYEGVAQITSGDSAEAARKMAFANRALAAQERRLANQQTEFLASLFA